MERGKGGEVPLSFVSKEGQGALAPFAQRKGEAPPPLSPDPPRATMPTVMLHSAYRRPAWVPLCAALLALALATAACGDDDDSPLGGDLILATTTSVRDSGLLDDLVPLFERRSGVNVKVIAVGTGAALRLAEDGNADALFVHAPDAERALVDAGHAVNRRLVMYNDFLLLGPDDDPAVVAGSHDAAAALARIAAAESRFVSRGDGSGTHQKELALWAAAGVEPRGSWYQEAGQGMGATLTIADQKRAYVLTDRATFLALSDDLELRSAVEGDPALLNLYSVMQVAPGKGGVNAPAAAAWVDFTQSREVQDLIRDFRRDEFGRPLFVPAAGKSEQQAAENFSRSAVLPAFVVG